MFKRIEINYVRSCNGVVLDDLPHVVALIGRNGAGKTNLMRAIEWAAVSAVNERPLELLGGDDFLGLSDARQNVVLHFQVENITYKYELAVKSQHVVDSKKGLSLDLKVQESLAFAGGASWYNLFERIGGIVQIPDHQDLQIADTVPTMVAIESLLSKEDDLLNKIRPAAGFLRSVHYYSFDEPNLAGTEGHGIIQHGEYAQWLTQYERKGAFESTSVLMRLIHMYLNQKDSFEEVKELLGERGLGILSDIQVSVLDLPGGVSGGKVGDEPSKNKIYFLRFMPISSGGRWTHYGGVSLGARRLLRILVSTIFDKTSVMLIEQPEDGIHPGLLHKLIPLLKTYADPGQVFLASHSTAVFNRLTPKEIRLVDMQNGNTLVRALTPEEIEGAEKYISEDGPLSDYLETVQGGD